MVDNNTQLYYKKNIFPLIKFPFFYSN